MQEHVRIGLGLFDSDIGRKKADGKEIQRWLGHLITLIAIKLLVWYRVVIIKGAGANFKVTLVKAYTIGRYRLKPTQAFNTSWMWPLGCTLSTMSIRREGRGAFTKFHEAYLAYHLSF